MELSYAKRCDGSQKVPIEPPPATAAVKKGPLSKPKLPAVYLCCICRKDVLAVPDTPQQESAQCSLCKLWCHAGCGKISDITSVTGSANWFCPKCNL